MALTSSARSWCCEISAHANTPNQRSILDDKVVGAKQGEKPMACDFVKSICPSLLPGVVTGDAGIVSPDITRQITEAIHDAFVTLRCNAGKDYHLVKNRPWHKFEFDAAEFDYGHGRTQTRGIRIAQIEGWGIPDLEKYLHSR